MKTKADSLEKEQLGKLGEEEGEPVTERRREYTDLECMTVTFHVLNFLILSYIEIFTTVILPGKKIRFYSQANSRQKMSDNKQKKRAPSFARM